MDMFDPRVTKLAKVLGDTALAERLADAGYDDGIALREASDRELQAIAGVNQEDIARIRARFPAAG